MDKITFDSLTLEITRRCNMACRHCLRGDAQDIDMSREDVNALLDQTQLIGKLVITGGEPSIAADMLRYIAEAMIDRRIPLVNLEIYTNGKVYSDELVRAIERFREIIDITCRYGFADGASYNAEAETSRCYFGVSLDRYHTDQDICEANYQRYKQALRGKADVLRIRRGNIPQRIGRAVNLDDPTYDTSLKRMYDLLRRIEVLDLDHFPACKNYKSYRLAKEDQKIVCCNVYMSADGLLRHGIVGGYSYDEIDAFSEICKPTDDIWAAIQNYNSERGRCSCMEIESVQLQHLMHDPDAMKNANAISEAVSSEEAQDELSTREIAAVEPTGKQLLDTLLNDGRDWRQYERAAKEWHKHGKDLDEPYKGCTPEMDALSKLVKSLTLIDRTIAILEKLEELPGSQQKEATAKAAMR